MIKAILIALVVLLVAYYTTNAINIIFQVRADIVVISLITLLLGTSSDWESIVFQVLLVAIAHLHIFLHL